MAKKTKEFFSVLEVAKIMHISRVAVFKKIKSGVLPAEKIGRNYIIAREQLDTIMGSSVSADQKKNIEAVVKRAVKEYGVTFRRLGKEE
jgi:excisionase family DNA binding protein